MMHIDFNENEVIFLYGLLSQKIKKLTELQNHPDNPISSNSLEIDIELYSAMSQKLLAVMPNLQKLNL